MASHNLDHQPEEVLITEIAELKRQLSELRTLQLQGAAAINYSRTAIATQNFTFSANSGGYLYWYLEHPDGLPIFTTIESNFYQDSVSAAQEIGSPLNNFRDKWDLDIQIVENLSTTAKMAYRLYAFNHDVVSRTIYWNVRGRFIVAGGSSVST